MKNNFDLKQYLTENKLTRLSEENEGELDAGPDWEYNKIQYINQPVSVEVEHRPVSLENGDELWVGLGEVRYTNMELDDDYGRHVSEYIDKDDLKRIGGTPEMLDELLIGSSVKENYKSYIISNHPKIEDIEVGNGYYTIDFPNVIEYINWYKNPSNHISYQQLKDNPENHSEDGDIDIAYFTK